MTKIELKIIGVIFCLALLGGYCIGLLIPFFLFGLGGIMILIKQFKNKKKKTK